MEYSLDGKQWQQMRIAHLHKEWSTLKMGIYACSPMQGSFEKIFSELTLGNSQWNKPIYKDGSGSR